MASQKTKFTVGLFVASGIAITIVAFIWLGVSNFLEKGNYYVAYFDESVQGLTKDSPVKYRGVSIGRVESIGVAPDAKLVQVVLKMETGQKLDQDIVAQLKSVGITGIMFVELDRRKEDEPDHSPHIGFPSEYPIVASKPSEISELIRSVDDVLNQLESVEFMEISQKVKLTLDNINQKVTNTDVESISRNIEASLGAITRALANPRLDRILAAVETASQSLNTVMGRAEKSLIRAENTLGRVEAVFTDNGPAVKDAIINFRQAVQNTSALMEKGSFLVSGTDDAVSLLKQYLIVVAGNLEKASESLARLTELLADQPSQLLFGEPPAPRKVDPEFNEQ